jgi:molecular chaperone DnaK (HSP70)
MYILGIDFGTTNSCVTITDVNTPITEYKVLENDLGYRTTPSILFISDQKDIYIGEIASTISKTQSIVTQL